jgi:hypothetical protein
MMEARAVQPEEQEALALFLASVFRVPAGAPFLDPRTAALEILSLPGGLHVAAELGRAGRKLHGGARRDPAGLV